MNVIIPMAGKGERFVKAGYQPPKPMIPVDGKRIIRYITESFSPEDNLFFIVNKSHCDLGIHEELNRMYPNAKLFVIDDHKKGPVWTVAAVMEELKSSMDPDSPVIVSYCDNPWVWNYQDFLEKVKDLDGCILSHTGFHPHTLSSTKMAFMKTKGTKVLEIKEKECYTNDPTSEHASTGMYYFRSLDILSKYVAEGLEKNINYNGECYVTLLYNLMIRDGLRVDVYPTEFALVFGTPEEVRQFEAWSTIVKGSQAKTPEDAKNCFQYWSSYFTREQPGKKVIRVDIDETICLSPTNPDGTRDYHKSCPVPANIDKINKLYYQGNTIIYWTARGSRSGIDWSELTKKQLDSWGCKYHKVECTKPYYDLLIDDKSIIIEEL